MNLIVGDTGSMYDLIRALRKYWQTQFNVQHHYDVLKRQYEFNYFRPYDIDMVADSKL
jgi:hypothetical protein